MSLSEFQSDGLFHEGCHLSSLADPSASLVDFHILADKLLFICRDLILRLSPCLFIALHCATNR